MLSPDSNLPKKKISCFNESLLKMMKNTFYSILNVIFVLNISIFLSLNLGHIEETALLEKSNSFQNVSRHNLVNKRLQCTYCPISHKLKITKH